MQRRPRQGSPYGVVFVGAGVYFPLGNVAPIVAPIFQFPACGVARQNLCGKRRPPAALQRPWRRAWRHSTNRQSPNPKFDFSTSRERGSCISSIPHIGDTPKSKSDFWASRERRSPITLHDTLKHQLHGFEAQNFRLRRRGSDQAAFSDFAHRVLEDISTKARQADPPTLPGHLKPHAVAHRD
ncbi:hypothetical protein DFH06DRAFT_1480025 [Mycena polygramma]|nr:hypothetical protein DFH06DRAFT_1480025 [Mycena polygramma]